MAEVRDNVAPWFGNVYSRRNSQPPEPCRDDYEYYGLWEITERVAGVFQESERFEALAAVHDDLIETRRCRRTSRRRRSARRSAPSSTWTGPTTPRCSTTQDSPTPTCAPFGVVDAFGADDVTYETAYDHEQLLEVDPDVILHQYGVESYYDVAAVREELADHPVAGELSAIENDRFYPSGNPVQGPIMNLFQIEMTAKQLFPERFGEWPAYELGDGYPDIPDDERLFDRDRVAGIVTGEAE